MTSTVTRIRAMYDSTTPAAIPENAEMVAGYLNGDFTWTREEWARFKNAVKVGIVISAINEGHVLDVETGDATPQQAPGWVKARRAAGHTRPTVYVNRSNAHAVIDACAKEGLEPGKQFWLWLATLDGTDTTDLPAVVAIQDKDAKALGFNADSSVVLDPTWHPSPMSVLERFARIAVLADEIGKLARA